MVNSPHDDAGDGGDGGDGVTTTTAGSNHEFVEGWTLAQTLGEGAYGEVKLLINRNTGEAVAMKMVDLKKHPDAELSVRKEVCIQKVLQHNNILRYFGKRRQGQIEYIFLEYAAGGELFDRIEPDVGMPQHEAQIYFKQLLNGLDYLHQRGIAHRDLKPENLLLDEHDNIKISDFGMATMFRCKGKERLLDKRCGTLPYVAPEVLLKPYYAQPADIWSCGIILVTMIAGELPWDQPTAQCKQFMNWKGSNWQTFTPWSKLDTLALTLLRKVLQVNSNTRITLDKILDHKWCKTKFLDTTNENASDLANSAALLGICSPRVKRLRQRTSDLLNTNFDDTSTRNFCTQPLPVIKNEFNATTNTGIGIDKVDCCDGGASNNKCDHAGSNNNRTTSNIAQEARASYSFSQPALLDDLLLATQMNQTQSLTSSQNVIQRFVRRMTRFFVSTHREETIKRLLNVIDSMGGYSTKVHDEGVVTLTTVDRRKLRLVFKAYIIDMDGQILVDFRLSKGCGLEFKRRFIKIKLLLKEIILKGPTTWPIAIATNVVP